MVSTECRARFPFLVGLGLCAAMLLNACGGDEPSPAAPAPPQAPSQEPTASFIAPATAAANTPIVFDASASASTDGSALQFFWDFGNGQRGGGVRVARLFASGGAKSVKLTVIDGAGRTVTQSKTVNVSDPPAAATTISVQGAIETLAGVALDGVNVSLVGTATAGITDAMGKVRLNLGTGVPLTLKLAKPGYADQFVRLQLPVGAGADGYFAAVMRTRDAALTLDDAAAGGTLSGRDGALLTLPPNALANAAGNVVAGAVQVAVTPVDVTQASAAGFPGSFDGVKADGTLTPIVSFGVVEYILTAAGQALQLAPGKTATIEVPTYATQRIDGSPVVAGDTLPLWSLDETTGIWVQEGEGTIVVSAASPTGLAMRATVSHLSWWNSDIGFDPYGPQPRCVYDTDSGVPGGNDAFATFTVCDMLAEFDRGPTESPTSVGSARKAAAALSPRVVGYSRRAVLPIAGGVTMAVPAGVNIVLTGTALNGLWMGRTIVNGAVGVQAQELVKMRPIATTGPLPEPMAVPFDAVRSLSSGQVALFSFSGAAFKYARITAQANGSTLTGRVRLMRGSSALGTANFGAVAGQIVALLPVDGTYTVELTALTNAPGAYRLQLELLGGLQSETLSFPFDVTKNIPPFTVYRGSFTITAPRTVLLANQSQGGASTSQRVLAPDGSVLTSAQTGTSAQSAVVTLPAAGTYTLELAPDNAQAANIRISGEATSWQNVGPALEGISDSLGLVDLVADRNGKPVVGYLRPLPIAGSNPGVSVLLRRWTGNAWESVGADLPIELPCYAGYASVTFAFDSNNDPVVAYGTTPITGLTSSVKARRYLNGAWQPLGPNDGTLPTTSSFGGACSDPPRLAPGLGGALAIAYRSDNNVVLQRFDGSAWVAIVSSAADTFPVLSNDYDLAADPSGRLHFVLTGIGFSGLPTIVRRLSIAVPPAWEILGPNGGVLPQTNTVGLLTPKLRFDAGGNPVIGMLASIGTSASASSGTAVYRYNGTQWSTTGGFQADSSYVQSNVDFLGFAVLGNDAFMGWTNARLSQNSPVVQKNTAAGWTPVGGGQGEIPQYSPHGLIQAQTSGNTQRLIAVDGELYLALVVANLQNFSQPTFSVALLRKVAD